MSPGGLINIRNDIMGPILPEQKRNIKNAFEHLLHRFVSNDLNYHCIQQKFNPSSNLSMSEQHTKVYHQGLPFYWIKSLHVLKVMSNWSFTSAPFGALLPIIYYLEKKWRGITSLKYSIIGRLTIVKNGEQFQQLYLRKL